MMTLMKTTQHAHPQIVLDARTPLRERLVGPAALFVLVVLFNWKLVLTNQFTWLESPDLSNGVLPWFQYQAGQWHHGHFPMWDPNIWFGLSLFGQGEPGAAYPLNWLLFLAPLKHGWIREAAMHWYFVLIHYGAALTCYALVRDLGRSRAAAILAGCVYALGGYLGSVTWPQMINGAVWSPLVFLFLLRAARGQRPWASAILSGFFLGFGWLAGHHQMNLFVSIAAGALWLWLTLREGRINFGFACLAAGSIAVAILASSFVTLPMAEYGRRTVRWVGADHPVTLGETVPYNIHQEYALPPTALLSLVAPNIQQTFSPFVGIVAFALGLSGAILAWKERAVRWFAMISLGGILFALGPMSLLHGVLYSLVPLVDKARVPAAGIIVFAVGFAPLAAYGADLLPRPESSAFSRCAGQWLLGLTGALTLLEMVLWAAKKNGAEDDRVMITAVAAALLAAILAMWRTEAISARTGTVAVIALVLFELANVTNYYLPNRNVPAQNPYLHRMTEHGDLIDYIRSRGIAARTDYDTKEIPYNIGDWFGIETAGGLGSSVPVNIWGMDVFSKRGREFFGVRYYLAKDPPRPDLTPVFQGRSGIKVFEDRAAYPRVWAVHQAVSLADSSALLPALTAESFDGRRAVLLTGAPAPQMGNCQAVEENVQMPYHGPNQLTITADLRCRGMVILTDAWFPGWRATVDGKPARIYQVYGGVRGVMVDAGSHVIQMNYRPWSIILGGALTALAGALALLAGLGKI